MKIYALLDYTSFLKKGITLEEFINRCEIKGALYLQYRDKISTQDIKIKNLKYIRSLWSKILIVNDDITLTQYCDGLHVGQEDLASFSANKEEAVNIIREKIGKDKVLGVSTHNIEEIEEANSLDIDYIGLGAYRDTSTKNVTNILGDKLPKLAAHSQHPVMAIGGVRIDDEIKNAEFLVIGSNLYED